MSLEKKIAEDLKAAMKAKDQQALRGIRAIKAAILLEKTKGGDTSISEGDEIKILQKLVKQRKDSLTIYQEQGREDLAQTEKEEIEIIERYLPEQMSAEELEAELKAIIAETGASSMRDMGKVMGLASKKFAGRADGKTISAKVKELLG
ncbi:MAG: GatB/YqeY domain-containing protein [Chitinophagales bacterium]|nr:GatB/YqeY domain-containing protein [Chitinophagales bacterium]